MLIHFILAFVTFGLAVALTPWIRELALRMGAVDHPGGRKIHRAVIPRLGGVSLVVSMGLTILLASGLGAAGLIPPLALTAWLPVGIGASLVFLFGLWDDLRPLPAWLKFAVQGFAAWTAIQLGARIDHISALGGEPLQVGILSVPLTLLWIVGLTNAFNLIDGLDGLAAGLGLIAAGTSATIFFLGGQQPDGVFLLLLCGALAGFLRHNFHPATIFLGDSGSQFIGFVLAVTAVTGSQKAATALPVLLPILIFGLPLLDTGLSMVRRAAGETLHTAGTSGGLRSWVRAAARMAVADRDHLHHRLLAQGLSQRTAVLLLYALATALSGLAVLAVLAHYRNAGAILAAVLVSAYIGIRKLGYDKIAFERSERLLRWGERIFLNRLSSLTIIDAVLVILSFWLAYFLKFGPSVDPELTQLYVKAFPWVVSAQIAVLLSLGLYRGIWRALGVFDFITLIIAIGTGLFVSSAILAIFDPPPSVYAFLGIDGLLLVVMLVSWRAAHKSVVYLRRRNSTPQGQAALIYGAGRQGECVLRELVENPQVDHYPIGFIDDDPHLKGLDIQRHPVLGSSYDLPTILRTQWVSSIIISTNKIRPERVQAILRLGERMNIRVLRSAFVFDELTAGGADTTRRQPGTHPLFPDLRESREHVRS